MILFDNLLYCQMMQDFCLDFSLRVSTSSSFYICFCSLLINTCLVFISYFVSVPLRKGYRVLEYQCSFVRLYLFLFAFLIIFIETFCIFDYLHWDFWFFVDFCNTTYFFVCLGWLDWKWRYWWNLRTLHTKRSEVYH